MGVVIKADNDSSGVERPQVAMHSQLSHFLVNHALCRCSSCMHAVAFKVTRGYR